MAAFGAAAPATAQEVKTVASVDLKRYAGKWYEIAKIPNSFQKKCLSSTTAEYTPRKDGQIDVAIAARPPMVPMKPWAWRKVVPGSNNSKLQVRFAPAWLSWIPMVWGDYWIMELDEQYSL
jgi:apolipoprotein D and lipocalin family protein